MPSLKTMRKSHFDDIFTKEQQSRTLPQGVHSYWDTTPSKVDLLPRVMTHMGAGVVRGQDKVANEHGFFVLRIGLDWGATMYVPSKEKDPRLE